MNNAQLPLTATAPGWLSLIRQAMQGERGAWIFVGKAMLSMYVTLALAMALELPSPSMAMLTVLVVMNSQSGMVMAKSFFRILGTALGVTASVVIVAVFPQQPLLMLTTIALWSGLCAAGALMHKGFRGYTFVLGGYTVAMIVLPIVNTPEKIFDVALHRFIEVLLGLGVTTLVFDGLFPVQLAGQVKKLAQTNISYLLAQVSAGLNPENPASVLQLQESAGKATGLEDLLNNAVFEGPWLSNQSRALKRSNHYFMQTITRLQSLIRLMQRAEKESPQALQQLTAHNQTLRQRLSENTDDVPELIADLQNISQRNRQQQQTLGQSLSEDARQLFATGAVLSREMLRSLIRALHTLTIARPSVSHQQLPRTRFSRTYDPVMVMLTMARTSLVTLGVGLLWMASGWSSGATGMFIVVALSMMLAPLPNPVAAIKLAAAGHTVAPFIALACFSLLPSLTTFPLLVMGTAPFLMSMLYLVTRPGWAGFAIPLNFGFMVALNISHSANTDYVNFFNEMLAAIVGVSLALTGFLLFPAVNGSAGQLRRYLKFLDDSVRKAVTAPLPGLAEHLESRNRDISVQMVSQLKPGSAESLRFIQRTLLTQEICYVVLALRDDLSDAGIRADEKLLISDLLDVIANYWENGNISAAGHARLNVCLALALQNTPKASDDNPLREHLYLLTAALDELLSEEPDTRPATDSSSADNSNSGDVCHAR